MCVRRGLIYLQSSVGDLERALVLLLLLQAVSALALHELQLGHGLSHCCAQRTH